MCRIFLSGRVLLTIVLLGSAAPAWAIAHLPPNPEAAEAEMQKILLNREVDAKLNFNDTAAAQQQREAISNQLRSIRKPRAPDGSILNTPALPAAAAPNAESLEARSDRYMSYGLSAGAVAIMGFLLIVLFIMGKERKKLNEMRQRQSARIELKTAQSKRASRPQPVDS